MTSMMPPLIRALLSLWVGIVLLVLGGYALFRFKEADWFTDPGPYAVTWEGYNKSQFVALVFFTFLTPIGFTLCYVGMQFVAKLSSSAFARGFLSLLLVFGLIALAAAGSLWAQIILVCGGTFCVNPDVWQTEDPPIPEAGHGWLAVIGCSVLFCCGPLALAVGASHLRAWWVWRQDMKRRLRGSHGNNTILDVNIGAGGGNGADAETEPFMLNMQRSNGLNNGPSSYYHPNGYPQYQQQQQQQQQEQPASTTPSASFVTPITPYRNSRIITFLLLVLYLFLLTLFFFTTTTVPNSWEYFVPDRIASFAATIPEKNGTLCGINWATMTCPEMEGAIFRTIGVRVTSYWVLKLFPGNLALYLFLALAPTIAVLARMFAPAIISRALKFRLFAIGSRWVSLSEIVFFSWLSLLVIVWVIYWMHDHNYNGYWPAQIDGIHPSELISRMFGQLAVLFMSLLMFPAARSMLSSAFFGVSWEAGIEYHRYLGILFLLASLLHMAFNYVWFADAGNFPEDIMEVPMHLTTSIDNFTVPLISLVLWVSIITLGIFAIVPQIRRMNWELFYYSHHITYCLLIPAVLWHAAAGWEYLLPGVTLWFADRVLRAFRSSNGFKVLSIRTANCGEAGRISEIRVDITGTSGKGKGGGNNGFGSKLMRYHAGQYVFVNIAELSLFAWHPFTIASASEDEITLMIKDMGRGTWTGALFDLLREIESTMQAEDSSAGAGGAGENANGSINNYNSFSKVSAKKRMLTLSLDGPYGKIIDFSKYENVLLVSGGIGITPSLSIFQHLSSLSANNPHTHNNTYNASQHLSKLQRVFLLWTSRDGLLFSNFGHPLLHGCRIDNRFSVQLACAPRTKAGMDSVLAMRDGHFYATNSNNNNSSSAWLDAVQSTPRVTFTGGARPDICQTLLSAVSAVGGGGGGGGLDHLQFSHGADYSLAKGEKTVLFVCGPGGMSETCERLAAAEGWSFHAETFEL